MDESMEPQPDVPLERCEPQWSPAEIVPATIQNTENEYSPASGWLAISVGLAIASLLLGTRLNQPAGEIEPNGPPQLLVDINRASVMELQMLPDIGPATAERIVQYVKDRGPIRRLTELDDIDGIGPKTLAGLKPYLSFYSGPVELSGVAIVEPSL